MIQIPIAPMLKTTPVLKLKFPMDSACSESRPFPSIREVMTMSKEQIKKVYPILSKKGISEKNCLNRIETTKVAKPPTIAALGVVFFQNMPKRKIATTPGVINPVYS